MRTLLFLLLFLPFISFSQTRKQKPLSYKTIQSDDFAVGDRINMGSLVIQSVDKKYRKFTAIIPDSFEQFRNFVFSNPQMEFRVVVIWQQTGRKFPSLTQAVEDTLFSYFRKPSASEDNRLYINSVYNSFSKKIEGMQLDLEILAIDQSTILSKKLSAPPITSSEPQVIYRSYNSLLSVDTVNIPPTESIWIEDPQLYIKYPSRGKAKVRLSRNRGETFVHLYSGKKEYRQSHGVYIFDVRKLPEPDVFIDGKSIKEIRAEDLKEGATLTAKYKEGRLPEASFYVSEMIVVVAGKQLKMNGKKVTAKVAKAINRAPAGSEISVKKIAVAGSRRVKFYDIAVIKKD